MFFTCFLSLPPVAIAFNMSSGRVSVSTFAELQALVNGLPYENYMTSMAQADWTLKFETNWCAVAFFPVVLGTTGDTEIVAIVYTNQEVRWQGQAVPTTQSGGLHTNANLLGSAFATSLSDLLAQMETPLASSAYLYFLPQFHNKYPQVTGLSYSLALYAALSGMAPACYTGIVTPAAVGRLQHVGFKVRAALLANVTLVIVFSEPTEELYGEAYEGMVMEYTTLRAQSGGENSQLPPMPQHIVFANYFTGRPHSSSDPAAKVMCFPTMQSAFATLNAYSYVMSMVKNANNKVLAVSEQARRAAVKKHWESLSASKQREAVVNALGYSVPEGEDPLDVKVWDKVLSPLMGKTVGNHTLPPFISYKSAIQKAINNGDMVALKAQGNAIKGIIDKYKNYENARKDVATTAKAKMATYMKPTFGNYTNLTGAFQQAMASNRARRLGTKDKRGDTTEESVEEASNIAPPPPPPTTTTTSTGAGAPDSGFTGRGKGSSTVEEA